MSRRSSRLVSDRRVRENDACAVTTRRLARFRRPLVGYIAHNVLSIVSVEWPITDAARVTYVFIAALFVSPFAFALGMGTGFLWVAVVRLAKEVRKSPVNRYGSGSPKERE